MLEALCHDEFARETSHRGLLKNSCYSKPHNEGVRSATMLGDFFFTEALCRVMLPGKFRLLAKARRLSGEGCGKIRALRTVSGPAQRHFLAERFCMSAAIPKFQRSHSSLGRIRLTSLPNFGA